jgi:hypothetical protein
MKPIVKIGKAYFVELEHTSIQMWLDVYALPEEEPKRFVMTLGELMKALRAARKSVAELERTLDETRKYVALGLTRDEVDKAMMGDKYVPHSCSTTPYDADEDLKFHYNSLSDLYDFIYYARDVLEEE